MVSLCYSVLSKHEELEAGGTDTESSSDLWNSVAIFSFNYNGHYIVWKKQDQMNLIGSFFQWALLFPPTICHLRFLRVKVSLSFTALYDYPLLSLVAILSWISAEASEQMPPVPVVLSWCVYLPF